MMTKYYMSQMYVTKKQLVCDTDKASVILSPGKMVKPEYEGPGLVVCS